MRLLLFDFDSTLVTDEGLDLLFARGVRGHPDASERIAEFGRVTDRGMAGELAFHESLERRLALLEADRGTVAEVADLLASRLSPSVARHRAFFQEGGERIHIVSGGFHELISPTAKLLGVPPARVHANRFSFDGAGRVIGADPGTALARGGKPEAVHSLPGTPAERWVIGDGATDLELRDLGLAAAFVAFTENVARRSVIERADHVVASIDELLALLDTP